MINLLVELDSFTDWLNEEKGQIFTTRTDALLSWDDGTNRCSIIGMNDTMVANDPAMDYCVEYMEWKPQREPGRQSDIEDYVNDDDSTVDDIQTDITRFLEDKQHNVPEGAIFTSYITVTMEVSK